MQDGAVIEGDGGEKTGFSRRSAALIPSEDSAEALLRTTLDALSAHIAVLDETGTIIAVNAAWRAFAAEGGYSGPDHGLGANYLAVCERSAGTSGDASRTAKALKNIIAGKLASFRMEYPCQSLEGMRWFQLRVTSPGTMPVRRVVVAHEDITDVKRAQDGLARLSARILQLQDDERRRIARELHDTTAQNLLAITLSAARMQNAQRSHDDSVSRVTGEILALAEQSLQEVRTLSYLLHPPLLDEVGLEAALKWLAKGYGERSGIRMEARIDALPIAPALDVATAIFRIAQEALSNVHRHSESSWARLSLRQRGGRIELCIEDGGLGMEFGDSTDASAAMQAVGVGISGMRVRVAQLGGSLELLPRTPGLLVRALFPAPSSAGDLEKGAGTQGSK
jgi:signal transduction histidine kinase